MDFGQLAALREVGQRGNVTQAARALGVTQPALSRTLDRLARELGVPLLERHGRGIRLTRFGEAFLPHAERALREVDDGRRRLDDLGGAIGGPIALGFLHTLGTELVPALVRDFRAQHPDVAFELAEGAGAVLVRRLLDGELDLCLNSGPPDDPRIAWTPLGEDELILITPRDHRLAKRRSIALREVAGEPFVGYSANTAMRALNEELCRQAGFTPHVVFEGDETGTVTGFVAAGLGVAIVPALHRTTTIARLRITVPEARRTIGILQVADRYQSAAVRAFIALAASRAR